MKRCLKVVLVLLVAVFYVMPVFAEETSVAKLTFGENRWITLHYLMQVQGNFAKTWNDGKTDEDAYWSKTFHVRKSRIILKGQIADDVSFFMETDDYKIGINDNEVYRENSVFTQDAFINYKFADELQIAAGMILLPFMHHSRASSVSLLTLDFNSLIVPLSGTTNVWRDTGVEFRGLIAGGILDYKVGVFQGLSYDNEYDADATPVEDINDTSDDINPYDNVRYCGRVQINLMDPETGFFYSDNYLGKKNIVSFGGGIDFQNHAVRVENKTASHRTGTTVTSLDEYLAWTLDATIDYKLGDDLVFAFQGAYVSVKNQPGKNIENQYGYFGQAGLLIGKFQPVVKYLNLTQGKSTGEYEKKYIMGGLNYFKYGHNANIKVEYQYPLGDDHKDEPNEKKATIQLQLFI